MGKGGGGEPQTDGPALLEKLLSANTGTIRAKRVPSLMARTQRPLKVLQRPKEFGFGPTRLLISQISLREERK